MWSSFLVASAAALLLVCGRVVVLMVLLYASSVAERSSKWAVSVAESVMGAEAVATL